jgi:hypothetical protein
LPRVRSSRSGCLPRILERQNVHMCEQLATGSKQGLKAQFSSTEHCHPLSTALNSVTQDLVSICVFGWDKSWIELLHDFGLAAAGSPLHPSATLDGLASPLFLPALSSFPSSLSIQLSSSGWPGWLAPPLNSQSSIPRHLIPAE